MKQGRYDPHSLKGRTRLNGEEAGILMIYDLVETFRSMLDTGGSEGLISAERKHEIVAGITGEANIRRYSELKLAHDYLASVPATYESYAKTAEVYYLKVYRQLSDILHAELENARDMSIPNPPPPPEWRQANSAEVFLSEGREALAENLSGFTHMIQQCIARQTMVNIIGEFLDVPEIAILVTPPDTAMIDSIRSLMDSVISAVKRTDHDYEKQLQSQLGEALKIKDASSLIPGPQAIQKATRALSYSTFQGGMEAAVALLGISN